MGFVTGKKLRLKIGGKWLWHATECSLSVSTDMIEAATKDTRGKVNLPEGYGYTLSTSALLSVLPTGNTTHVTSDDLFQKQLEAELIEWQFSSEDAGTYVYSGMCYVTQTDLSGATGSIGGSSFSLVGDGDIAYELVD